MGLGPSDRLAGWAARLGRRLAPERTARAEVLARGPQAPPPPAHGEPPVIDVEASATRPFPADLLRARSPRWLRRLRAGSGDLLGEPLLRQIAGALALAAAVLGATSLPGAVGRQAATAVRWTLHRDDDPVAAVRSLVDAVPGLSSWLHAEGISLPAAQPAPPAAGPGPQPVPAPAAPGTTPMGRLVPPLQAPVAVAFGAPVLAANGSGKTAPSQGILFWATASAPVHAIAAGQVLAATSSASLGRYVLLNHLGGWSSLYAHCESLLVQPGERVGQGQSVCTTGRVGSQFGPYLYFELLLDGRPVDPAPYLGLAGRARSSGASTGS
jgi:hypothetical protein